MLRFTKIFIPWDMTFRKFASRIFPKRFCFFTTHKLAPFFLIIISYLLITCQVVFAAAINDWIRGDGSDAVEGDETIATLDDQITNYLQEPLDNLLDDYVKGATGTITSDTVYTVSAGQVCCVDSSGVHRMRENTSTTTVTNTSSGVGGLDTGSLAADTWYYIYAVADADATTFTAIMSASASAPTNAAALWYKLIGCALTDADSDWLPYYWSGNGSDIEIMWDVPMSITTTQSHAAWSAALDCSSAMPSISTKATFGYGQIFAAADGTLLLRPNGGTWSTNPQDGLGCYEDSANGRIYGRLECMTDSSQQIQHYESVNAAIALDLCGFTFQR